MTEQADETTSHMDFVAGETNQDLQSTVFDQSELGNEGEYETLSRWRSLKNNLNNIFHFKPQSQEYLYMQLFGEVQNLKSSMLIVGNLDVIPEENETFNLSN